MQLKWEIISKRAASYKNKVPTILTRIYAKIGEQKEMAKRP
jgi:hypothetical protein